MIAVTSPGFVLFAALLAGLWYACPPPRRWQLLLGANLLFYAVLCPAALPVLAGSSFLVWWCGRRTAKKPVFLAGLAAALLPLALLKYLPAALGWQGTLANALGIGYFTLQLVSYLCDVRRGRILPEEKYARLLCYASFFLSITQGPFNRYDALMPQLDRPTVWDTDRVWRGVQRSAWGYFKKLAVADRAAVVVDAVFANPAAFDRTQLLLGGVLFTVQLYADFSGYTDIVLGVGEVLGLHLPENFRQPFFSASVKELWARWHISLSQWFRDYVYIPLGGNRKGIARRDANLLLTFLVSGLWHGANWTFLVWGGLHGLCQVAEDHMPAPLRKRKSLLLRIVGVPLTFAVFVTTFTIFRTSSLGNAAAYFAGILHNPGHEVFAQYWLLGLTSKLELLLLLLGIALLVLVDVLHECGLHLRAWVNAAPRPVRWAVYEFAIFAFLLMASFYSNTGFLYARF